MAVTPTPKDSVASDVASAASTPGDAVATDVTTDSNALAAAAAETEAEAKSGDLKGAGETAADSAIAEDDVLKVQAVEAVEAEKSRISRVLDDLKKVSNVKAFISSVAGHGGYLSQWEHSASGKAFIDAAEGEVQTVVPGADVDSDTSAVSDDTDSVSGN
jgi:hypothetical protein